MTTSTSGASGCHPHRRHAPCGATITRHITSLQSHGCLLASCLLTVGEALRHEDAGLTPVPPKSSWAIMPPRQRLSAASVHALPRWGTRPWPITRDSRRLMERMEGQANCDALLTALLAATCNAADLDVIGGGRASVEAELRLGAIDVEEDLRLKLFLHGSSCCSLHVGEEKKMGVREKRMGGRERREKMF
jgi:hypothetical protein